MRNGENLCETILNSYQYEENNYQILTEIKIEADPIMEDFHCVTVSNDKIFSVDDTLEIVSNLGICDLFEQTSSNARLNLTERERIGSEPNIVTLKLDSQPIKIVLYLIALGI